MYGFSSSYGRNQIPREASRAWPFRGDTHVTSHVSSSLLALLSATDSPSCRLRRQLPLSSCCVSCAGCDGRPKVVVVLAVIFPIGTLRLPGADVAHDTGWGISSPSPDTYNTTYAGSPDPLIGVHIATFGRTRALTTSVHGMGRPRGFSRGESAETRDDREGAIPRGSARASFGATRVLFVTRTPLRYRQP